MTIGSTTIDSNIELYDSDIKAITDGPMGWYNQRSGSWRSVDEVYKGLVDQFQKIGFQVDAAVMTVGECKCHPPCRTPEACRHLVPVPDAYMFTVTILDRIDRESGFDFDKMKHEVRHNLLEIPGEGGTIKFDEKEFLRQHGGGHRH